MEAEVPQGRIASVLEVLGSVSIAFAAAFCSGIATLRNNPIAIATLLVCSCVLFARMISMARCA